VTHICCITLKFAEIAQATVRSVVRNMEVLEDAFGELSEALTTNALGTNQTFPYFTFKEWDRIALRTQELTSMMSVATVVIINDPIAWANYSAEYSATQISPVVWAIIDGRPVPQLTPGVYAPVWQMVVEGDIDPALKNFFINLDYYQEMTFRNMAEHVQRFRRAVISDFVITPKLDLKYFLQGHRFLQEEASNTSATEQAAASEPVKLFPETMPISMYGHPLFDSFADDAKLVGYVKGYISWNSYFDNVLLKQDEGIYVVVRNTCNGARTWLVKAHYNKVIGEVSMIISFTDEWSHAILICSILFLERFARYER
jgi:hypothetical protein